MCHKCTYPNCIGKYKDALHSGQGEMYHSTVQRSHCSMYNCLLSQHWHYELQRCYTVMLLHPVATPCTANSDVLAALVRIKSSCQFKLHSEAAHLQKAKSVKAIDDMSDVCRAFPISCAPNRQLLHWSCCHQSWYA